MTGVSTQNLPASPLLSEVIGNARDGATSRTVRTSIGDLAQILMAGGPIADAIDGVSSGFSIFVTLAALAADLSPPDKSGAWVIGDATAANNGIWRKVGASGTGNWTRAGDLPYSVIGLTITGTANALQATSQRPVPVTDMSAILLFMPILTNTGPATITINGSAAMPIITSSGANLAPDALDPAWIYPAVVIGGSCRLLIEGDFTAAVSSATAASISAAASAAAAATSAAQNTNAVVYATQTLTAPQKAQARSNIGAAAAGANSDIASLSGLTTPLSVGQGGTGDASGAGLVQPGTIVAFPLSSAPPGYLKANAPLLSRTVYSALFAKIGTTFGAGDGATTFVGGPDMRGEFPRGWDDGRGVDSGRSLGSAQGDAFRSHTHTGSVGTTLNNAAVSAGFIVPQSDGSTGIGYTGGAETRPRNIALLYCIKY